MHLESILNIKPGQLIKGVSVRDREDQQSLAFVCVNLDGWVINGVKLEDANVLPDDTIRIVGMTGISDCDILDLGNLVSKITSNRNATKNLNLESLRCNTAVLRDSFWRKSTFVPLAQGEVVGMSLGESILSFFPAGADFYHKNTQEVWCLHRVLHKNNVIWIRLVSQSLVFNASALNCSKIVMEMF